MSFKAIATSTLWQIGSQAAMAFLSIITTKLVTLGLSQEFVGYYNSAYGYLQIFAVIADFGLYAVSVREISKAADDQKEHILGAVLALRLAILFLSFGVALLYVWVMPAWRGTPFPIGVTIASLVPFFTILAGTIRAVFQVRYKMHFVFVAEVLQRVVTTLGIGLFIVMGVRLSTDVSVYEWFLWIGGIGAFVLFTLSFLYANRLMRVRVSFDWPLVRKLLLLAAPFGVAYTLMAFYRQMDVVFIALLRPDFAIQNAYYGLAGRVEDMAFLIPTFLLNSLLPILTMHLGDKRDAAPLLRKTFFILLLTGSVFALFSWLWARPFTLLFATPAYLGTPMQPGSDTAFALMSIPMFLNGLVLFSFYVFLAHHAWKRLTISFGVGVILTAMLNLLLTPLYGFVGAATSLIIVHCFLTLILLPPTLRLSSALPTPRELLQWLGFSVILGVLLFMSAPFLTSATKTLLAGIVMILVIGGMTVGLGIHRMRGFEKKATV